MTDIDDIEEFDGKGATEQVKTIEKQLLKQAEAIADTLGLKSVLILGTMMLDRRTVTKVVGFDGSLFELVHIADEFVDEFNKGAFSMEEEFDEEGGK